MQDPTVAVFGSYNARSTSAEVVAAGFVAPRQFWEILPLGNTVLTGPRGSGKTTLLKMLTSPGLERWDDERAEEAIALANYSGVFVPADRSWTGQVDVIGRQFDDELSKAFANAAFTLHSLHALVQCARWRNAPKSGGRHHDRVSFDAGVEEQITRGVYSLWGLEQPAGSFLGLQLGVCDLITKLGVLANGATVSEDHKQQLRNHPALSLDLVQATLPFIERFNIAAEQEDHVWAFLIDEIEFLPQGIQARHLGYMRGRDPRIIQKVSIAPYTAPTSTEHFDNPLGGWEGHDLQRVDLTFTEKEQGYSFSRELAEREIAAAHARSRKRVPGVHALLGGYGFFGRPAGEDAYGAGSANAQAIKGLATEDASFRTWLAERGISPEHLDDVKGVRRSQTVQKAIAIILLRSEFLHEVRGELQGRSRKRHNVYVGEEAIFAICENNPRLLKALVGRLLALHFAGKLRKGTRADAIEQSCKEYHLHLRAIEVDDAVDDSLLPRRLVDVIGKAFAAGIYGDEFDPEPPLAFDVNAHEELRSGLATVLNQLTHYGAIVPVGEQSYRLAHMFAPLYRLPLRKGRSRSLASMMRPEEQQAQAQHPAQLQIGQPAHE